MIIKKIHQTSKDLNLKPYEVEYRNKILNLNPDYEYKLWTDDDLKILFKQKFPKLYEIWDEMKGIQKADFGRYAVLYEEGGFYSDTDI